MIVIYGQHRDALTVAERRMVAAMRDLPGVLLVNALVVTGRRTREIDGVWISPAGIAAIEVKGTRQRGVVEVAANGPWRIGGELADFASGPNPLLQTRTGAQVLRSQLEDGGVHPGFIPGVVAVSGTGIDCPIRNVGALTVTAVDALRDLPQHLKAHHLGDQDAIAALSALGLGELDLPSADELAGEGFTPGSHLPEHSTDATSPSRVVPAPDTAAAKSSTSRDRRRARRFADLEEQARTDWQRSNRRRLVASALALVILCGYVPILPFYCAATGVLAAALVGVYQLARRRRQSGHREEGLLGAARWVLSLVPVAGVAASLSWMAALPTLEPLKWPFVMLLAILLACALACAVLAGKSSYVYPPAIVIERYDEKGRPTGAFMLAQAHPLHLPSRDWRPAEPAENDPVAQG